jgi:hypothetical protein
MSMTISQITGCGRGAMPGGSTWPMDIFATKNFKLYVNLIFCFTCNDGKTWFLVYIHDLKKATVR